MRKIILFLFILLFSTPCYAQGTINPPFCFQEEDGDPSVCLPVPIKVANGNLTVNEDGSISIADQTAEPGASTAYDDIGDPDAAGSISFDANETATYTTVDDDGEFFIISNTDADLAHPSYMLSLKYTDDGSAYGVYLRCVDDAGGTPNTVFTIGADGAVATDGSVTATGGFSGALTGNVTGDVTGNADTATLASTLTITDNENTNETNAVLFTSGGDLDGGNLGIESDGNFYYNPSSGTVTSTAFAGNLTGNVTGDCSGNSGTTTEVGTLTNGDLCINDASAVQCTVNTEAEIETALDGINLIVETEIDSGAELIALIDDETGTGVPVFNDSPTFADDITIHATGVKLTGDGDGALTILGLGDGNDEDLTINLDDTENVGTISSSTGLATLNFSGIALQEGGVNVINNDEMDASSELASIIDDETGSGLIVFATSPTFTTSILAASNADIGSTSAEFGDLFLGDGKAIKLGADQDVTITHVADTGIQLELDDKIMFGDTTVYIHSDDDGYLDIEADTGIRLLGPTAAGDNTFSATGTVTLQDAEVEVPNGTADKALATAGEMHLNTTDEQVSFHSAADGEISGEASISLLRHLVASFDPGSWYDSDGEVFLMKVGDDAPEGITIVEWALSCNVDPDTELALDLKYADAWIGLANAAVIDVLDTTNGVSSEDTNASINSGSAVANGKVIYLSFDSDPEGTCVQATFEMWFYNEED